MRSFRTYVGFIIVGVVLTLSVVGFRGISSVFQGGRLLIVGFFDGTLSYEGSKALEAENLVLKKEVMRLSSLGESPFLPYEFEGALRGVYSRYPFNTKGAFVVDFGERDLGVQGMPVLSKGGVLVGRLTNISRTQSEVQTIFDDRWATSVAVGDDRVEAVLAGGRVFRLELVPKDANISVGDIVVNISPEFPLNVPVGVIKEIRKSQEDLLPLVSVDPFVRVEELREVVVVTEFP